LNNILKCSCKTVVVLKLLMLMAGIRDVRVISVAVN
jgi:hypothetical protein